MPQRTGALLLAFWAAIAAGALALSLLAAANDTLPGDEPATEWLQDQALPGQDLSDVVRAMTTTEVVVATGAALALILWLRGYRRQALLLVVGVVALVVTQSAVKEIVDRPRPNPDIVDVRADRTSPSFPSGHIMSGTFLYGWLLYLASTLPIARAVGIAVTVAAEAVIVLSAVANVWTGAHWPSDVLGGYLWAAVLLLPLLFLDSSGRSRL